MSRPLVHAHFVDFARERLGERGPAMVGDACRGGLHAKALKQAMRCDLREYVTDDGDRVLSFVMPCAAGTWIGSELQLESRLPDTIQQVLPGRRLGDVVTGCGAEEVMIRAAGDRNEGTRLFLERSLVDPSEIDLPRDLRLRTPLRLLRNHLVLGWQEIAEHEGVEGPWAGTCSFVMQILLIGCCTLTMLIAGLLLYDLGTFGLVAGVPLIASLAWLISAMTLGCLRHGVALATSYR